MKENSLRVLTRIWHEVIDRCRYGQEYLRLTEGKK